MASWDGIRSIVRNQLTRGFLRWWACGLFVVGVVFSGPVIAQQPFKQFERQVDLELVLAVDVSLSMDSDEQKLQRNGYVAAFRDRAIHKAIQSGPNGRIAVTYLEWAGAGIQAVVVPWRIIETPDDAIKFADELEAQTIPRAVMTSISAALDVSRMLFGKSPVKGLRKVVDVSGDGPNNSGGPVEGARDKLVADGIVVNGLAIQIKRGVGAYSYFDLADLDRYYADCVIGGPGSFVLSIKKKSEFATAIRQKLLLEIAGRRPAADPARIIKAQASSRGNSEPKYDCLIGEKMWNRYLRDRGDQW